ncbi:MAG: glycosyltransferase family 61 protein [Comamonadaceae bacterium]|nr:MAG: glycosyltransferase family 61 protein [Comamonadaceae bacterium]
MSRSFLTSGQLAGRFRSWVRQNPTRFAAYTRFREALHWLRWMPYHGGRATKRQLRRVWNVVYWLPYRAYPAHWQGTPYARAAESGFPPAPVPRWARRLWAAITRTNLARMGTFIPVRHAEASDLAHGTIPLVPAQEVVFPAPKVFGPPPPGWPAPWPDLRVPMAPITAAEWRDATVVGKFDTVLVGTRCIVGDLWQRDTERTFDEVRDYAHVGLEKITYFRRRGPQLSLERAIVVVGGPTGNWAHWTTEYLPKVALIDAIEQYRDWPLVIDEGLHPNIVASLELVARKRELVRLPEGVPMRLHEAVTVGSPGYTAYEYRYDWHNGPPGFKREHTVFSPAALDLVRRRAWQSAAAAPARQRLIYITRPKGSMRPFVGGEEVERFFAAIGFEILDTGSMTAAEQVRLFSQARCIVGQSGAGITNLVFAPPGCRVIVFAANSPHSIFHYFANMGAAAGHRVYYCFGESIYEPGGHPGHAGFTIELEDAKRAWQSVVQDEPPLGDQQT